MLLLPPPPQSTAASSSGEQSKEQSLKAPGSRPWLEKRSKTVAAKQRKQIPLEAKEILAQIPSGMKLRERDPADDHRVKPRLTLATAC